MNELSCQDLRTLYRETPTALVLVDRESRITTVNEQAAELFGWSVDELVGEPVETLVPDGLEEAHREHRDRYVEDPEPRPMGIGRELEAQRRDGSTVPVEISLSPVRLEEGPRVMAVVRDISERKQLRSWGTEALEAAEEERLRIAQELHDDLAQRLAALQVRAKLVGRAPDEERRGELIDGLRDEIRLASEHVRQIIRGLRPPALSELGLGAALRHELQRQLDDRGVERDIELVSVDGHEDRQTQVALYRVGQEAVRNAIQHADPSRIVVRLERDGDGWLELTVADDGRGFAPEEILGDTERYGVLGMRERVQAVGGRFELESEPGRGTVVRARVPLSGSDGDVSVLDAEGEELGTGGEGGEP